MDFGKCIEEILDELVRDCWCRHEECPHKDCSNHPQTTKPLYFLGEDYPSYMPRSHKEMINCTHYMDK